MHCAACVGVPLASAPSGNRPSFSSYVSILRNPQYVRTAAAKSTHAEMKEYIDGLPLSEDDKLMLMRLAEMAALMKVAG